MLLFAHFFNPFFMNRQHVRDKIIGYLSKLDAKKSVMHSAIHSGIQYNINFENVIDMVVSQYYDNKNGMISVVGEVPMALILIYSK